jgi:hypothetical protein
MISIKARSVISGIAKIRGVGELGVGNWELGIGRLVIRNLELGIGAYSHGIRNDI